MTYGTHMWIDEIDFYNRYFQSEPTVAAQMERMRYWEPSSTNQTYSISMEADSLAWEKQNRAYMELKNRRRKEMENCLHGARPYPIHWKPGTHPLGYKEFWVNIEGMNGGPYLLSEGDHDILHNLKKVHTHV